MCRHGDRQQAQSCDKGDSSVSHRWGLQMCTHRCVLIRPSSRMAPTHLGYGDFIRTHAWAERAPLT